MTTYYVRSTDGNNTNNGLSWAAAKANLTGVDAIDVAGDTIYVSQVHAEINATAFSPSWAGTRAAPTKIICANDGAQPPTTPATTGSVSLTAAGNMGLAASTAGAGGGLYWYGIVFNGGSGATATNIQGTQGATTGTHLTFESCSFNLVTTASGNSIQINDSRVINCSFKLGAVTQFIQVSGLTRLTGGSVASGGTSPTTLFKGVAIASNPGRFVVEAFDLSNCSATVNLYDTANVQEGLSGIFRSCKLPASWSGSLVANAANMHLLASIEMIGCWSSGIVYAYWRQTYAGSIRHENTIVRSGGASNNGVPLSWKMASTPNCLFPVAPLISGSLLARNSIVGSSMTATVEFISDNLTIPNDGIWLELMYLSSSGAPIYTRVTDSKSDVLGSNSSQPSSSVTWVTTGLINPIKQKLTVTFTPQLAGYVRGRIYIGVPNVTVYVDPKLTLS